MASRGPDPRGFPGRAPPPADAHTLRGQVAFMRARLERDVEVIHALEDQISTRLSQPPPPLPMIPGMVNLQVLDVPALGAIFENLQAQCYANEVKITRLMAQLEELKRDSRRARPPAGSAGCRGELTPKVGSRPPSSAHFERKLSVVSEQTLNELGGFERQFDAVDSAFSGIIDSYNAGTITAAKAKTDLAQLEAKLNKLADNGVDSIETSSLTSGREEARALKKQLTQRAVKLQEEIDVVFQQVKELLKT